MNNHKETETIFKTLFGAIGTKFIQNTKLASQIMGQSWEYVFQALHACFQTKYVRKELFV